MSTQVTPRRGTAERITGAIWGAIVTAVGAFLIAALSGYRIDLELITIVSLAALGGWLLVSAIAAGTRQTRRERAVAREPEPAVEPEAEAAVEPAVEPEPRNRTDS